jgi:hypothetical protein
MRRWLGASDMPLLPLRGTAWPRTTCAVLWFESAAREAPWLIKNLDRDERSHRDRCPTISTTIYGQQLDEEGGRPGRIGPSGP